MGMIQQLNNKLKQFLFLFGSEQVDVDADVDDNEHNYDFHVLVQLLSKLPEDVMIQILVLVPADVLVLCPIWRNLISSTIFVNLHFKKADSIHVVQSLYHDLDECHSKTRLSIVDSTRKKQCIDLVYDRITKGLYRTLWGSCGGLLAFWSPYKRGFFSIVNPITRENRDISIPTSFKGYLCAFCFDRFQDRYKLLYVNVSNAKPNVTDVYYTFDLSESMWRKLDLIKSCSNCRPSRGYPGVLVADALHWIAHARCTNCDCSRMVVVFKIETQELYSLPHPPITTTCYSHTHESFMKLIAKDGQLCFCHIIDEASVVDLWILEDYENWGSWVKRFKINLLSIHNMFPWILRSNMSHYLKGLAIGSPQSGSNEILVICNYLPGLYGYHLETHRSRQLETIGSNRDMYDRVVLPYTKTMLSPMF